MEYQLLEDVVAKCLIAKADFFVALTIGKFQMMTTIMKIMKIKWSFILFITLKNMVQHSKQSFGFSIPLSKIIEDSGIPFNTATSLHKYRILNAHRIKSLRPKAQALNISPTEMLVVKMEIEEDLVRSKKISKVAKSKVSQASKSKAKRKLITHESV